MIQIFTARDWQGKMQQVRVAGDIVTHANGVTLLQQRRDRFAVVYGLQVKQALRYADAAREFGLCVMHSLACEGKLDVSEHAN